jgi:hypothetical protein
MDLVISEKRRRGSKQSEDEIYQEDWNTNTKHVTRIVRQFRDLPMHVLITCHEKDAQEDGYQKVVPSLTPALRESVMGMVDVIAFLGIRTRKTDGGQSVTERVLLTENRGKVVAKDRSPGGKLGGEVVNPTMPMLLDRIIGKEKS